jgi:hypothetical protein
VSGGIGAMTAIAEWAELLRRRPAFHEALKPIGRVIAAWESASGEWLAPLACAPVNPAGLDEQDPPGHQAAAAWSAGTPLLQAFGAPSIPPDRVEPLLAAALDVIDPVEETRAFAAAWDRGEISPADLLPVSGRIGSVDLQQRSELTQQALAFLAVAGLRPALGRYFEQCRPLVDARLWDRAMCPSCGAPPGFAELLEDGRRQLACHLCDARWTFGRLICPFCDSRTTADFVRLIAEEADEGYAIAACRACGGYIKEIDRRARWNAGSAIVEDWGSPHLDLIAHRRQYWRPMPTLIQLAAPLSEQRR